MTPHEISQLLALLGACYTRETLSTETLEAYRLALAHLPFKDAKAAVLAHVRSNRFFPSVAEISLGVAESRLGIPTAEVALAEVLEAAQRNRTAIQTQGSYVARPWSHPLVEEVVGIVGWGPLVSGENLHMLRPQFIKCYGQLRTDAIQAYARDGEAGLSRALPAAVAPLLSGGSTGHDSAQRVDPPDAA